MNTKDNTNSIIKEILKFLVVGGIATLIDYFVSGIVLYLFEPSIYPHFYSVFLVNKNASTLASVISTILGFTAGLIFNYVFSIIFVYIHKGESKSVLGFILFALLSIIGLAINAGGMYIGYEFLNINYWILRIVLTVVVMIYNYLTKKLIIFKENNKK